MTAVLGTSRLSSGNLTGMSLFWWLTRSQNSHVMPHQLEAFKLARQTNTPTRGWWVVMLLAAVWGLLFCSYAVSDLGSSHGANAGFAPEIYRCLQSWISPSATAASCRQCLHDLRLFICLVLAMDETAFSLVAFPSSRIRGDSGGLGDHLHLVFRFCQLVNQSDSFELCWPPQPSPGHANF